MNEKKMAQNEKKKQSAIEKRIAEKLGNGGKTEKAAFVCSLDGETFERFGHLVRWTREVHGISLMKFAEMLYRENQQLQQKIAEQH
jgi:ribosome-binding protein aMBF1 (putative translation factor)